MEGDYRETVRIDAMVTKVYLFIDDLEDLEDLEDLPLLCGELSLTPNRTTNFKYSECYLDHGDAFALDPLNLPLSSSLYHSDAINYFDNFLPDSLEIRSRLVVQSSKALFMMHLLIGMPISK